MSRVAWPENRNLAAAPSVLAVSGFDPLGYSGLLADVRHLHALGLRGLGAITALTSQSVDAVLSVGPVSKDLLASTIVAASTESSLRAVKVGLVPSPELVSALAEILPRLGVPIVLDPVLRASSGPSLVLPGTAEALVRDLLPLVSVVVPNWDEALALVGKAPGSSAAYDGESAARALMERGAKAVILKGGHADLANGLVIDRLFRPSGVTSASGPRIPGRVPRGTGCAFASVLTGALALGADLENAFAESHAMLQTAIAAAINRGARYLELLPIDRGGAARG